MSFEQDFAKTPPGPQRERLVYQALVSQGRPTDLWPVTINGPQGTKITFYITRDFLKVGNQYLPMTGTTAQMIANKFNMYLPTNTIADRVWEAAKAAGTTIKVDPLSGTGYRGEGGQWYSGQDVSNQRLSSSDAAVEFSKRVNQQMSQNPNAQKGLVDIGSGGKWLTVPPASGSLGLHGIRQEGGPVQGGYGTKHPNYESHVEYGTYVRLVDNKVVVQHPDGRKETMTMDNFIKSPFRSALFAEGQDIRDGSIAQYNVKRDRADLASLDRNTPSNNTSATPALEGVDNFLDQVITQVASRMRIYDRIIKQAESDIKILPSIGKDPAIKDLSARSIPGRPPAGYRPLKSGESNTDIGVTATKILNSSSLGDQTPFTINGKEYMGRTEPHFHPSPPPGADPKKYPKPWGWHKGVTVFKKLEDATPAATPSNSQSRMALLQKIQDTPAEGENAIENLFSEIERDV